MKDKQIRDITESARKPAASRGAHVHLLHTVRLHTRCRPSQDTHRVGFALLRRALPLLALVAVSAGCGQTTTARLNLPPLRTVASVDLERYLGRWYEIANYPNSFQKGCVKTTAEYSLKEPGVIEVVNRCRKDSPEGKEKVARGRARVVDEQSNARLKVSFFRPFWGDYWIVELDPDYRYAVVGHPGRDYLWILSRTPTMDEATFHGILSRLKLQDYDTSRIVRTVQ